MIQIDNQIEVNDFYKQKRKSFVIYRSVYEALQQISDTEERLKLYDSICAYALNDVEPDLSGTNLALFMLIRPNIDANRKKYENGKKGAIYGKRGGRPKGGNFEGTIEKPQNNPKQTPNVDVDADVDANKNINNIDEPFDSSTELSFDNVWALYGRKGNKKTSLSRWKKLSLNKKRQAFNNIPLYVKSTPEIKFRKNFEVYINQEAWNDEILTTNENKNGNEKTEYDYFEAPTE